METPAKTALSKRCYIVIVGLILSTVVDNSATNIAAMLSHFRINIYLLIISMTVDSMSTAVAMLSQERRPVHQHIVELLSLF